MGHLYHGYVSHNQVGYIQIAIPEHRWESIHKILEIVYRGVW